MSRTLEILVSAKNALVQRGWTKNTFVDTAGCLCTVGAINLVAMNDPDGSFPGQVYKADCVDYTDEYLAWREGPEKEVKAAVEALRTVLAEDNLMGTWTDEIYDEATDSYVERQIPRFADPVEFNDAVAQSVDDVLAVFDKAIARLSEPAAA